MNIELPYMPRGAQVEYFNADTRFCIGRIGRQWGKSMIAMLRGVVRSDPGGIYWWVEPTIAQSYIHMGRMYEYYKQLISYHNRSRREIRLINGARWFFKGADNPENLEGETLDGLVLDEAAKYPKEVWFQTLRPMLAVKGGWCDFIGKPRGNNYYKQLWNNAQDKEDWTCLHFKSSSSPFFSEEEYEEARQNTPINIFEQEYNAEFVDDTGGVFGDFRNCIRDGILEEPIPGKKYWAGVDLGKTNDYTVITIMDDRKIVRAFERFNSLSWPTQKRMIYDFCTKYNNATITIDSTGLGSPIYDDLVVMGLNVTPYQFTNATKNMLIDQLIVDIANERVTIPDLGVLTAEMENFIVVKNKITSSYQADDGMHDDCVISLALVNYSVIGRSAVSLIETSGKREFG